MNDLKNTVLLFSDLLKINSLTVAETDHTKNIFSLENELNKIGLEYKTNHNKLLNQPYKIEYSNIQKEFAKVIDQKQFFIGRIGGSDWDLVSYYYQKVYLDNEYTKISIIDDKPFLNRVNTLKQWNGYYDLNNSPERAVILCEYLIQIFRTFDLTTVGHAKLLTDLKFLMPEDYGYEVENGIEYRLPLIGRVLNCKMCNYRYIEDLTGFLFEITPFFTDKKILVISPFTYSFFKQYKKRREIFKNHPVKEFELPDFKLITLPTPITYEGVSSFPDNNWFETSEKLCNEIKKIDFDYALLGCGLYSYPLGAFIKSIGKGAIYMGGALQLYFGVTGRRYAEQAYYKKFLNNSWTYPLEKVAKNNNTDDTKREGLGAYW
jgi:hypothetical protein